MSLPSRSVEKFLRENFSGENPITVKVNEREAWMEKIKARVDGIRNVKYEEDTSVYYANTPKERYLGSLRIYDSESSQRYYYLESTSFNFRLDDDDQLFIHHNHHRGRALISDLGELVNFIVVCNERLDRRAAQNNKRKKVRGLKSQAMLAQIKKIAREEQFNFATRTDTVKMKLFIQLYDDDCIELHIPFTEFQEVLPKLRDIFQSARALYEHGIKLKMRKKSNYGRQGTWISYEDL